MRWVGAKSRTMYFQAKPSQPIPSQQTSAGAPWPVTDQWILVPSRPCAYPSLVSDESDSDMAAKGSAENAPGSIQCRSARKPRQITTGPAAATVHLRDGARTLI